MPKGKLDVAREGMLEVLKDVPGMLCVLVLEIVLEELLRVLLLEMVVVVVLVVDVVEVENPKSGGHGVV